jgi:hypothetical protein
VSIEQQPATFQVTAPWLLLHRAGVRRHIAVSEAFKFAASIGFKAIHVDVLAEFVMAGAGKDFSFPVAFLQKHK